MLQYFQKINQGKLKGKVFVFCPWNMEKRTQDINHNQDHNIAGNMDHILYIHLNHLCIRYLNIDPVADKYQLQEKPYIRLGMKSRMFLDIKEIPNCKLNIDLRMFRSTEYRLKNISNICCLLYYGKNIVDMMLNISLLIEFCQPGKISTLNYFEIKKKS